MRRAVGRSCLAVIALASAAHAGQVGGRVVEPPANTPLPGAEIALLRLADSTLVAHATSGADGAFHLDSIPPGRYRLRAALLGHTPAVRTGLVLASADTVLALGTLALAIAPLAIPGTTTTTERATAIVQSDRNVYLTRDMPNVATGTATDVLRSVPELDVDIDGHVSLRGSSSVNLQFNGRAAPMKGEALTAYLRQMPANRIERVEVIANPSAKFDPEGTAGIVNLVLKDKASLGLSGSVYAASGPRYSAPSGRIAWQQGPLTCFGGLSLSTYHYRYRSSTDRTSLLTSPASTYDSEDASQYHGATGSGDGAADYALTKRATLYGSFNADAGHYEPHGLVRSALTDSTAATSSFERFDDASSRNHTLSGTIGLQHVVQAGRDERELELFQSGTNGDSHGEDVQTFLAPAAEPDLLSHREGTNGYRERSVQADDTHPIGAKGKLELGVRAAERRTSDVSTLVVSASGSPDLVSVGDYVHREAFQSAYATLGSTFRHLSMQVGARGEQARTRLDVHSSGHRYDRDYRSLFPSLNVAWDFGGGRTVRASYSKRIERPAAYYLNPDVPVSDSLNRTVGNPGLGPRYTHVWTLEAAWSGSRGSLRLSPYARKTIDNWDLVTTVDDRGAAFATWRNASSIRATGLSVTGSLRQTGRWGGSLNVGVLSEHHDASNLGIGFRSDASGWWSSSNVAFKATRKLSLQGWLRVTPARTFAQGRASAYVGSSLNARYEWNPQTSFSVSATDPFGLSHFSSRTGDATFFQSTAQDNRMRSFSAGFSWSWGKPPEEKQRRQSADTPASGAPGP
jgi:outer membrane receptor for ferrienterochelin and colicin